MPPINTSVWTVTPTTAPEPVRHCPRCATLKPFASSGKIRLNANGKKLDAWLIYKCTTCDQTWNRPLVERQPIDSFAKADHDAMQHSLSEWVRKHEFDLSALRQHSLRVHLPQDYTIGKRRTEPVVPDWSACLIQLEPYAPAGLRVDRLLSSGLGLSRSQIKQLIRSGNIAAVDLAESALKRPLHHDMMVRISAQGLDVGLRADIAKQLGEE